MAWRVTTYLVQTRVAENLRIRMKRGSSTSTTMSNFLTPFEVGRIIGIRALQLSEGHTPTVCVSSGDDFARVAFQELQAGTLDIKVARGALHVHVSQLTCPSSIRFSIQ